MKPLQTRGAAISAAVNRLHKDKLLTNLRSILIETRHWTDPVTNILQTNVVDIVHKMTDYAIRDVELNAWNIGVFSFEASQPKRKPYL